MSLQLWIFLRNFLKIFSRYLNLNFWNFHKLIMGKDGSHCYMRWGHLIRLQVPSSSISSFLLTILKISWSFILSVNCIERPCQKRHRVIMVGVGTWRAPPRALSISNRIAVPQEQRRGTLLWFLTVIQVLNEPFLRQWTLNWSAEITIGLYCRKLGKYLALP